MQTKGGLGQRALCGLRLSQPRPLAEARREEVSVEQSRGR